jgi:hypothetical protein
MTKAEHKQRTKDFAYQAGRGYSKPAKKVVASQCLRHLLASLATTRGGESHV